MSRHRAIHCIRRLESNESMASFTRLPFQYLYLRFYEHSSTFTVHEFTLYIILYSLQFNSSFSQAFQFHVSVFNFSFSFNCINYVIHIQM